MRRANLLLIPILAALFFFVIDSYRSRINPGYLPYGSDWADWLTASMAVDSGRWEEYPSTRLPLFPLLSTATGRLAGDIKKGGILLSMVSHSLMVVPLFLLGTMLLNPFLSFINCLTLLTSIHFIDLSCWGNGYPLMTLLVISTILFAWAGMEKGGWRYPILAGITAGLAWITDWKAVQTVFVCTLFLIFRRGFDPGSAVEGGLRRGLPFIATALLIYISIFLLPVRYDSVFDRVSTTIRHSSGAGQVTGQEPSSGIEVGHHYFSPLGIEVPGRYWRRYSLIKINYINFFRYFTTDRYIVRTQLAFFALILSSILLPFIRRGNGGHTRNDTLFRLYIFCNILPYILTGVFIWLHIRFFVYVLPLIHLLLLSGAASILRAVLPFPFKGKGALVSLLSPGIIVPLLLPNALLTRNAFRNSGVKLSMDLVQTHAVWSYLEKRLDSGDRLINLTDLKFRFFTRDPSPSIVNLGKGGMEGLEMNLERGVSEGEVYLLYDNLDREGKELDFTIHERVGDLQEYGLEELEVWEYRMTPGLVRYHLLRVKRD